MRVTFDRQVILHPSTAECGTSLDANDREMGISRAIFHQVIDVIDAETGNVVAPVVNDYHFTVHRYEVLHDIDETGNVTIDLTPFAGRRVKIRARIVTGYNGRGP